MSKENLDVAIITDEDNVYYFSGYYDYLHMEFGRPTILLVSQKKGTLLITPSIDENMAKSEAQVDRIVAWNDGLGDEWRVEFPSFLHNNTVGIELNSIPQVVKTYIKKIDAAIAGGDQSAAATAYNEAVPVIDRMADKGIIHKNKAARHKSRLNAAVKGMK